MSGPPTLSKEQKQLQASLDITIQRLIDVKNSLQGFLFKLENESLTWPTVLDSFALVSSHLTILNKTLKNDKTSPFRSHGLLPLVLSQELDGELQRMTEGRVPTFNHEVVPHHLRTKPEPDVEIKENQITNRIVGLNTDSLTKQMNSFKRIIESMIDTVTGIASSMDSNMSERSMQMPPTHSTNDTQTLLAALSQGKGLKMLRGSGSGSSTPSGLQGSPVPSSSSPSPMITSHCVPGASSGPSGTSGASLTNKMASSVKTNIKAAASHSGPYSRP